MTWEYEIDRNGGGRIDAKGIGSRSAPVVIEFKRTASGLTICQGLSYLDWLDRHLDVFAALVPRQLGDRIASRIAWTSARLLCIAEEIGAPEEAVAIIEYNTDGYSFNISGTLSLDFDMNCKLVK